jgi:hypothetical protein
MQVTQSTNTGNQQIRMDISLNRSRFAKASTGRMCGHPTKRQQQKDVDGDRDAPAVVYPASESNSMWPLRGHGICGRNCANRYERLPRRKAPPRKNCLCLWM